MILAVVGCAGGVGCSTLAYELAAALEAVAVDGDPGVPGLPAGRGPDLHDALAGHAAPHEAVCGGPVDLLPCGRSLAGARAADETRLADAVRRAVRDRDAVLDCPTRRPESALAAADAALVVTTPAHSTRVVRRTCRRVRPHAGLVAVVRNRADAAGSPAPARPHGDRTDPGDPTGLPTHDVPNDPHLAAAIPAERPVVTTHPETDAAAAVRTLADAVERCRATV
ncbi:MAG: MinD/ParA family protein [Halobaculum sp.]